MEHEITGFKGTSRPVLQIGEAEFGRIKSSKVRLMAVLSIEEKFGMLLENYEELESTLLARTVHHMVFSERGYASLVSEIYLLVRRIQNLLSTARLYIDQVEHDLNAIYGPGSIEEALFIDFKRAAYESSLGYRAMEALRNYMQHRTIPLTAISFRAERRDLPKGNFNVHTAELQLDTVRVREDGGFKASVLSDLERAGQKVGVKQLVREYVQGLAAVHYQLRAILAVDVPSWEAATAGAVQQLNASAGGDVRHVSIVAKNAGNVVERHDIFDEPLERRQWLERRNSLARYVASQIVSSESS